MASTTIRVVVVKALDGVHWTWKQIARNGSVTAKSDQDYAEKSKAVRSAKRQVAELVNGELDIAD